MFRLFVFAVISEIPFDFAFFKAAGIPRLTVDYLHYTNIYYTLFLGVACVYVYELVKNLGFKNKDKNKDSGGEVSIPVYRKFIALLFVIPVSDLGAFFDVGYGMYGVLYIVLFYIMEPENRVLRTVAAFIIVFVEYAYPFIYGKLLDYGINAPYLPGAPAVIRYDLYAFLFALISLPLIYFYNGRQGPKVGMAFYLFYPVHIAVIGAIWYIM
jgi:hypothetical protein